MLFQYPYTGGGGVWQTLVNWGFVDAFLPFLLIFVLIFAVLQRIGLFQEAEGVPNRRINGVLSFIISAMVVAPHVMGIYPPEQDPIILMRSFLPTTAILLVVVLMVMILLGLAQAEIPNLMVWAVALVALGFLIFTILMAVVPGYFPTFDFLRHPRNQAIIIVLLIMGLVGWFVIRPPAGTETGGFGAWVNRWMGAPPAG